MQEDLSERAPWRRPLRKPAWPLFLAAAAPATLTGRLVPQRRTPRVQVLVTVTLGARPGMTVLAGTPSCPADVHTLTLTLFQGEGQVSLHRTHVPYPAETGSREGNSRSGRGKAQYGPQTGESRSLETKHTVKSGCIGVMDSPTIDNGRADKDECSRRASPRSSGARRSV